MGISPLTLHRGLEFVYPHGATLNVQKPATCLLSSGFISYPLNRPLAAMCEARKGRGRLLVVGSAQMFADDWITKEENTKLLDIFMSWVTNGLVGGSTGVKAALETGEVDESDLADYHYLPDTFSLSEKLRSCLQESDPLPRDFTQLFDDNLFKFDTNLIPEAVRLYDVRC